MSLFTKGSVAILAGALPLVLCFHSLPREIAAGATLSSEINLHPTPLGWIIPPLPPYPSNSRHIHERFVPSAEVDTEVGTRRGSPYCRVRPRARLMGYRLVERTTRVGPLYVTNVEGHSTSARAAAGAAPLCGATNSTKSVTTTTQTPQPSSPPPSPPASPSQASVTAAASVAVTGASKATPPTVAAMTIPDRSSILRGVKVNGVVAALDAAVDAASPGNPTETGKKNLGDSLPATSPRSASTAITAALPVTATNDEFTRTWEDIISMSAIGAGEEDGDMTSLRLKDAVSREVEVVGRRLQLRVASVDDYSAIADVRFDVFSPVHTTLKHRFQKRSCAIMKERREKGAFCLVAALEGGDAAAAAAAADDRAGAYTSGGEGGDVTDVPNGHVLATLECSTHEFQGTPLELEKEARIGKIARLYLTEVAVRSDSRKLGIGSFLLELVDDVAEQLETAEVFLHVNEINEAALRLYARCGYTDAPNSASNRAFTSSLGLSGGFIGQGHYLLLKTFQTRDLASASAAA